MLGFLTHAFKTTIGIAVVAAFFAYHLFSENPMEDLKNTIKDRSMTVLSPAVSMGGSNEFVECFCWGAVVEGGSGAVVELVGDGVEVWLVAGDGGSFG